MKARSGIALVTQNSLTGIYIHQDTRFTYVNDRLAHMIGYTPKDMIGHRFWEFVHPLDRPAGQGEGYRTLDGCIRSAAL